MAPNPVMVMTPRGRTRVPIGPGRVQVRRPLDASGTAPLDSAPQLNTGIDRDEYPSNAIAETRRQVRAGMAAAANGPGSPRTERVATTEDVSSDPDGADDQ